jgi:hypothetical protein
MPGEDRPPLVRVHDVAGLRHDVPDVRPRMLHRHELMEVLGIEGPGIHDLRAVGVDHSDLLALPDMRSLAAAGRDRVE